MAEQTVVLSGKRFVIVPERDYRKLQEKAASVNKQDRGDIAESGRRKAAAPSKSYATLRKRLGL